MPLRQQKQRKLFPVAEKKDAKVIALHNKASSTVQYIFIKTVLLPPVTSFNIGYLKEKENDPL